jgi:hypothetical protein
MHEVWNTYVANLPILEENAKVANAAKVCICSSCLLVHLSSHGTKEHCVSVGVIVHCSLVVYFIPFRRLVHNKYSRGV